MTDGGRAGRLASMPEISGEGQRGLLLANPCLGHRRSHSPIYNGSGYCGRIGELIEPSGCPTCAPSKRQVAQRQQASEE
jgi:hypothetical protein